MRPFKIKGISKAEIAAKAARNESIRLNALPMPDGSSVDVQLQPFAQFGDSFQFNFTTDQGRGRSIKRVFDLSKVTLLKGHVRGKPDSFVLLATSEDRTEGVLSYDGRSVAITRESSAPDAGDIVRFHEHERPRMLLTPGGCKMVADHADMPDESPEALGALAGFADDCHVLRIGMHLDYELYSDKLNSDGFATLLYVAKLIYGFDEVVRRDLGVAAELASLDVWMEEDPWNKTDGSEQLDQFSNYCLDPDNGMVDVERDAMILLSG